MAEVTTGLEGVLGYMNEGGTLGKVYYSGLTGSAGTRNIGIGTAVNTGSSMVYFGSGIIYSQGKPTVISQSTLAIGSAGQGFVCYNIEAGTGGVTATSSGTQASVADAISNRAGTTTGKAPLAYVTVGSMGSVLSGSIVDERTFLLPSTVSYVTGVDYSLEESKKDVWNRATFAHYKSGRKQGKLTVKENYVEMGSANVWPTSSTYATVPTLSWTLDMDGVNGTIAQTMLFLQCGKDSESFSQPEDDLDSYEFSCTFGSLVTL